MTNSVANNGNPFGAVDLTSYTLKEGQIPKTISRKRNIRKTLLKPFDVLFRLLF